MTAFRVICVRAVAMAVASGARLQRAPMEVRDGLAAVLAKPYLPLRAGAAAEPAWLEIAEASAGRSWSRS
jgi:hypothetical protein